MIINPKTVELLGNLVQTGIILLSDVDNNKHDLGKVGELVPMVNSVIGSINEINETLKKAQEENWTDDDTRWLPIFEKAEEALKVSLARLT